MSAEQKGKATLKNVEGKVQEAAGNITGDPGDKAAGKMKQAEAGAQHTVENAKDAVKEEIDKH